MAAFNSAERLIRFAMEDAGLLEEGQDPSSDQFSRYLQRLNDIVNLWQTSGLKLWLWDDLAINLNPGTATYTLGPSGYVSMDKPLRVLESYYLDQNNIRRPLLPMSWNDYLRLSQVTNQGYPNQYFVDKQQTQLAITFWPVPDYSAALGTCHVLVQTQVSQMATISASISFPQEWFMALRWALADELSTGQPAEIMVRCEARALAFKTALENWDIEDAPTYFTPDQRAQYATHSFR